MYVCIFCTQALEFSQKTALAFRLLPATVFFKSKTNKKQIAHPMNYDMFQSFSWSFSSKLKLPLIITKGHIFVLKLWHTSSHRNVESNIFGRKPSTIQCVSDFRKPPVAGSWSASPVKKHMNMSCRAMSKHLSTPLVWYDSWQPLSRLQCWKKCGEDGGWFLRMYNSIRKCMLLDYNSALWIYTKTSKYWIVQNVPCFIPFFSVYLNAKQMDCTAMTQWKGLSLDCTAQVW